jgi:hypothetical protein
MWSSPGLALCRWAGADQLARNPAGADLDLVSGLSMECQRVLFGLTDIGD